MSSKLIFADNIPKEILPVVKEKLTEFEDIIPGWVNEIRVFWKSDSSSDKPLISGEASGDFGYRSGTVVLCPAFMEEQDDERTDTAAHELVHILISPLVNFYHQLLHYLPEQDEKVRGFIEEQFSEKLEGVTVDVTNCILKMSNKGRQTETVKARSSTVPVKKKKARTRKKK